MGEARGTSPLANGILISTPGAAPGLMPVAAAPPGAQARPQRSQRRALGRREPRRPVAKPGDLHLGVARGIGRAGQLAQPSALLLRDALVQAGIRSHRDAQSSNGYAKVVQRFRVRAVAEPGHGRPCVVQVGQRHTAGGLDSGAIEEIRQYQSEGVKTVEMESAGLFTIGQVRRIPVVSIVVGMDKLAELRWQVPERLSDIFHSLEVVYAASLDVLKQRLSY